MLFVLACASCDGTKKERFALPALSLDKAADIVNTNIAAIRGTLRGSGWLDAWVQLDNGSQRTFSVDAVLLYLPQPVRLHHGPHLRLALEKFGETQYLIGSNTEQYWYHDAREDEWHCGRHEDDDVTFPELPIKPRQLVHALGLTPIPTGLPKPGLVATVQRVEPDVQQVLFVVEDHRHGPTLQREYWLDRFSPRLVRRAVFRNAMGGMEMHSELGDYRQIDDNGPYLPHRISVEWADPSVRMTFQIQRWRVFEQVTADGIQFALPKECGSW